MKLFKDTHTFSQFGYPGNTQDEHFDDRTIGIFIWSWCLIGASLHKYDKPNGTHWWFTFIILNIGFGIYSYPGLDEELEAEAMAEQP